MPLTGAPDGQLRTNPNSAFDVPRSGQTSYAIDRQSRRVRSRPDVRAGDLAEPGSRCCRRSDRRADHAARDEGVRQGLQLRDVAEWIVRTEAEASLELM